MRVLLKKDGEPSISTKRKLDSSTIPSDERREQNNIFKRRRQSEDFKGSPDNPEVGTRRTNTIVQVNKNNCKRKCETPKESEYLTKRTEILLNDGHVDVTVNAGQGTERIAADADRSSKSSYYFDSNNLIPNTEILMRGDTNKEARYGKKIDNNFEGTRDTCIVPRPGSNKTLNHSTMDDCAFTSTIPNPSDHAKLNHADKRNNNNTVSSFGGRESGQNEQRPSLSFHCNPRETSAVEGQQQHETLAQWGNASNEQTVSQANSFLESFQKTDAQDILAAACSAVGIDDELDSLMNSIDTTKQSATQPSTLQNQTLSTTEASPRDHASAKTVVSEAHPTRNMTQLANYPLPSNAKSSPRSSDLAKGYLPNPGIMEHCQMPPRMSHPMPAVQGPVPNKIQTGNQIMPADYSRMRPQNWPQQQHQPQQQQYQPHQHYFNQQQHMYQKQQYPPQPQQPTYPHPQYYRQLQHLNQQRFQYAQHIHYQMQQQRLPFPDLMLKETSKEQQHEPLRERSTVMPHPMYPHGATSRTILYRGPHPYERTALPNESQDSRGTVFEKSNPVPDIKHAGGEPRNHSHHLTELQAQHSLYNETANRAKQESIRQSQQIPQNDPRRHPQRTVERIGMEIVQPPIPLQSVKVSRKATDVGLPQSRSDSVNVICSSPNVIQRVLNPAHNFISNSALHVPNQPPCRSNNVLPEPYREYSNPHFYPTSGRHASSFDKGSNQVKSPLHNSEIVNDTSTSPASPTRTICVPPVDVLRFHRQEMQMPHHFIGYPQRSHDSIQNHNKSHNFNNFTGNPPQQSVPSSMSSTVNSPYHNPEVRLRALLHQPSRDHIENQQNTNTEQSNNYHKHNSISTVVPPTVLPEYASYQHWAHFSGRSNHYPTPEMQYPGYIVRDPVIERHNIPHHLGTAVVEPPPGVRLRPEMVSKQPTSQVPHMHLSAETNFRQQNPTCQRQIQDDSHLQHINYSYPNQLSPPKSINDATNIRPPLQNHLPVQFPSPEFYPRAPLHAKQYMSRKKIASPHETLRNLPQSTHLIPLYSQYSDRLKSTDKQVVSEVGVSRSLNSGQIGPIILQEDPRIDTNRESNVPESSNNILAEKRFPVHYNDNQPLGLQRVGQCIAEAHSILLADSTHESSERTWRSEEWQKAKSVVNHHGPSIPIRSQALSPDRTSYVNLGRFNSEMTGNFRKSNSETLTSDTLSFKDSESKSTVRYHNMESSKQIFDSKSTRNNPLDQPKVDYAQPANHPLPGSPAGNTIPASVTISRTPVVQVRGDGQMSSFRCDRISKESKYPYQEVTSHQNLPLKHTLHRRAEDKIDSNEDSNATEKTTSSEERIIKAMRNPYVLVTDIMKSKNVIRGPNAKHNNHVDDQIHLSSAPDQAQESVDLSHRSEQRNELIGRDTSDVPDTRADRRETISRNKRSSGDDLSNFRKVRRLSIDDNKQLENPSEEDSNDELPDIEKREHGSVAVIQGCPTDELPSCSYVSKHRSPGMPIRKRICKEDELFASSARADTPPSPANSSSYSPEWERAACCSLPEIQKAETTHVHEGAGDDTNPEFVGTSPMEDATSTVPKKCDKDTNSESNELGRDTSEGRPRSPARENDVQTPGATKSLEISPREIFLEQLQPVLNTLLSAPEAGSLRYLLHDPGRLLEEMVFTWGGKPSAEENYLTKMKQNFEIFLKLFVTPDKCSEWGWEGRSVEDILQLLNSDQEEVDESDSRPIEETELRDIPSKQEAMEPPQDEPGAAGNTSRRSPASPRHTDTSLVTSSVATSQADEQGTSEDAAREEPSPDSNCLDSSKGISPVVSSNLADSTITTSETSCSPTSSDQTVGPSSRCCCGQWCCKKFSGLKCPRSNEGPVSKRSKSNGKRNQSGDKIVRSGDTLLNSNDSSVCNDELSQPNAIIKSFATSTTDMFSSAHLELISDRSVSTESSETCYESTGTTFPTLDASPSENC